MSAHAIVWTTVAVGLAALLIASAVRLLSAVRTVTHLARRAEALADTPLVHAGDRAAAALARIDAATQAVPGLIARAKAAVAVIRRGPVPPELAAAIRSVRAEIAAFRTAFGR